MGAHLQATGPMTQARTERLNSFLSDAGRYQSDTDYRAQVDADRAARQAEIHAGMDAAIARYRAGRSGL